VEEIMSRADPVADKVILMTPDQVPWTPNPVIPNAQGAFLVGDPSKAEVTVLRVRLPPHCKHPPHTHPFSEVATVLDGRAGFGLGEVFEASKGKLYGAGTFAVVPAGQPHYIWTEDEEAIVQVQFTGPFGIDYVNPADDPCRR
jgi:quercetin dioxygenase-like cupin family protein